MDPGVIRRQMLMQQFTMMKFFLSALSTSKPVTLRHLSQVADNAAISSVVGSAVICK